MASKERFEQHFGAKSRWLRAHHPRCAMTGHAPGSHPVVGVEHAHVLGTRGAGHGPEGLIPLWAPVHRDFDSSMTDERFEQKWRFSRLDIREKARRLDQRWRDAGQPDPGDHRHLDF